jgi:ubiquinone/menaquinone biosynthesis C-methylase UbiE
MNYQEGAMLFYDFFGDKNDVDFYLGQAKKYGDKALEIGVGTGRLAIQLARSGIETWGLEISPYMLSAAEKKIKRETSEVQKKLHLIQGNAVDFRFDYKFDFIYFPSGSFDHILDPADQRKALLNFKSHLKPSGGYVFDLYLMNKFTTKKDWFVQKKKIDSNKYVVRTGYTSILASTRLMTLDLWYEVVENGRIVDRYFESSKVYLHKAPEVRDLLQEAGFIIVEQYGNHHNKEYEDGDDMIIFVTQV